MAGPLANRDTSVVEIGPGLLYIAPIGTTEPAGIADSAWPAPVAAVPGSPGTPAVKGWIELGYTDNGSEFKVTPTTDDVKVAEETDPIATVTTAVKSLLTMDLAQLTAFNLAVVMGGGVIVTSGGVITFEPPGEGEELEVMVGWRALDKSEAMFWRRCKSTASLDLQRRAGGATKAILPVEFTVLAVTGKRAWKWLADASKISPDASLIYPS